MNKNWKEVEAQLQAVLDDEVANGNECGCQLCIIEHGKKVVNIAAGFKDASQQEKCATDDLFTIFSSGKPLLAALAWKLAEKGVISYSDPVGKFWKEFALEDKAGITIEHLLSHRAGMYLLPSGPPDLTDWQEMCRLIAAMPPRHAPGAVCHYHPLTFAWLLGHTLELATDTPLPRLLKEYILEPAGIADSFFFGITEAQKKRVVPVDAALAAAKPAWEEKTMNDPAIRACCIPSFNGIGSAEALAEFYSKLRGTLVSEATFDFATGKLFRDPADPVREEVWTKFALGVILCGPADNRRMFIGHGGAAGAEGFYMPDEDIAFGFVKNRLSPAHPNHPVRDRVSGVLDIPRRVW